MEDNRKTRRLVCTLLEQERGKIFDPIQASLRLGELYGLAIDWHICSSVLEEMVAHKTAEYSRKGVWHGMHRYFIKTE